MVQCVDLAWSICWSVGRSVCQSWALQRW